MSRRVGKRRSNELNRNIPDKPLVDLIFEYPELYNKKNLFYTDLTHKRNVWERIATHFNSSGKLCKDQWNLLRGKFLAFHRTVTLITGEKHYLHEEMIRFLPYYTHVSKTTKEVSSNSIFVPDHSNVGLANDPPRSGQFLKLIDLVYHHSVLYDRSHAFHSDLNHLENTWRIISVQMNKTVDQCKNWWNLIVAKYFSFYRHNTLKTGLKHCLHNEMSVFLPYFAENQAGSAPRHIRFKSNDYNPTTSEQSQEAEVATNSSTTENIPHSNSHEHMQHDQIEEIVPQPTSFLLTDNFKIKLEKQANTQKSKQEEIADVIEIKKEKFANNTIELITIEDDDVEYVDHVDHVDMESISQVGSSVRSSILKEEHNDRALKETREELINSFFNAVSASVKNLTPVRQNQAKIRIFEIVSKLELEQLQDRSA